jgi:hypothetical protein
VCIIEMNKKDKEIVDFLHEVIVTYGDDDSVGKKMLRDKLATLRRCTNCGYLFEPAATGEKGWECNACVFSPPDEKEARCCAQGVPDYSKIK